MDLSRFLDAQSDPEAGYAAALGELQSTGKRGHWMWYIFPQLRGLGFSAASRNFGLADTREATAYLNHPVLGARLLKSASAVVDHLNEGRRLTSIMGSRTDAQKIVSCMTLFGGVARREEGNGQFAAVADAILQAARLQGFPECSFTRTALDADPGT